MKRYMKVLQLGDPMIDDILDGEVLVEEKLDGSMFRTQIDETGGLHFGSKSVDYDENRMPDKMFLPAIDACNAQLSRITRLEQKSISLGNT